jgi:hypothetical protein
LRPLRLDLDHVASADRYRAVGALLLVFSLAVAVALVLRYGDAAIELDRMQIARALVGTGRNSVKAVPKAKLDEEARTADAVLRQLTLPWPDIIRTIEEAATRDVAVLQMQPDALRRELRLSAEARNQDMMLEFLRRLASAKALGDVHIVSHQVQMEDPQRPLQFSILALMRERP